MSSDVEEDDEELFDSDQNEEQLDPRIRDKLEELNECTDNINKLEKQCEEMNALFRNSLNDKTIKLRNLSQKLGKCVSESRPYYECRSRVSELQKKCQMAVQTFERSAELHSQSKQTITIAEHKFADNRNSDSDFDPFWQEMLNQANTKFMEAKNLKNESQYEHSISIQNYLEEQKRLSLLEKQSKSAIKKSKPYYEESARVQSELNSIKQQIEALNTVILEAKQTYSKTLKDLEQISEEIHEKRAQLLAKALKREPGVGAEFAADNNNFSEKYESTEEVPHLDLDLNKLNMTDTQVMASPLSPNTSLASRSPLGLSSSSLNASEENSPLQTTQAFIKSDTNGDSNQTIDVGIDTNGNSFEETNSNPIDKTFVEIDLQNN